MGNRFKVSFKIFSILIMCWTMTLVSEISAYNIMAFGFFGIIFLMVRFAENNVFTKRTIWEKKVAVAVSLILSLCYSFGAYEGWTKGFNSRLFKFGFILVGFFGLYGLHYYTISILYHFINEYRCRLANKGNKAIKIERPKGIKNRIVWMAENKPGSLTFIVCIIAWLPYFLYLYPGVMTPDSVDQLDQAMGLIPYSNHHPWVHTLLIEVTFKIGSTIGRSANLGIAFYTVVQMFICALVAGFTTDTIKKLDMPKWLMLSAVLYWGIIPFNAVFAVTMWKDVIFGYGVLAFICALIRILYLKYDSIKELVVLGISGMVVCLFRSNGWYGFILSAIVICLCLWKLNTKSIKEDKDTKEVNCKEKGFLRIIAVLVGIIIVSGIVKGPVMKVCNVSQPDFVESISIPLQQVARVLVDDKDISQTDRDFINKVIDTTYINQLYDETFADNIKELVRAGNPKYLEENKLKYAKLYIKLGLRYPHVYMAAYAGQVGGYLYPDSKLRVADTEGIPQNLHGVSASPLIGGKLVVKLKEISIKLGGVIPLYGSLWCAGSIVWFVILSVGYVIGCKETDKLLLFMPCIAIIFTVLIATPVSGDFRYIYFAALSVPLFIAVLIADKS